MNPISPLAAHLTYIQRGVLVLLLLPFAPYALAQEVQSTRSAPNQILTSSEWKNFFQVVSENYIEEVNEADVERHCRQPSRPVEAVAGDSAKDECLRAAAESLSKSTRYYSASETATIKAESARKFVGIGLELTQLSPYVKVVTAIRGAPAERAGVEDGDLIGSIDGVPVRGRSLAEVIRLLRGEAGTNVTLLVYRGTPLAARTVVATRAEIKTVSVRAKMLSAQTGYLRISQFVDATRNDLIDGIMKLEATSGNPVTRLILDLRGCPGGLLNAVVGVSSLFVSPGINVLRTVGREPSVTQTYLSSAHHTNEKQIAQTSQPVGWPLTTARIVVLTSSRTAGGAEALAELLRERRQAQIVGEKTFGYGLIERTLPLEGEASVRLPVAQMFSPDGRAWHGQGLTPDVAIAPAEGSVWEYGDADLDNQLAAALKQINSR
jgi:carboxyl-terminal processing protease